MNISNSTRVLMKATHPSSGATLTTKTPKPSSSSSSTPTEPTVQRSKRSIQRCCVSRMRGRRTSQRTNYQFLSWKTLSTCTPPTLTFPPELFLTDYAPSTKQALKKTASSSHATKVLPSDTTQQQPYPEGPTLVTEQAQLFLWNSEKEGFEAALQHLIEASLVQSGQFQCKYGVTLSLVVEG